MQSSLILASTSKYRKEMLARLRLPFSTQSPKVEELVEAGETPLSHCIRLARLKAQAVATMHPDAIVIGSDQVADVNGQPVSKPGNHDNAILQLQAMSGQTIVFHSAVCVMQISSSRTIEFVVPTFVQFRTLSEDEIERYLNAEQPYDCAGSAKSEGLGISLLEKIQSDDPTALIGLPLIELSKALRQLGMECP